MKKTYYKGQQLSGCNASIVEMTSKEYALLTDAQKKAINAFVILTDVNDNSDNSSGGSTSGKASDISYTPAHSDNLEKNVQSALDGLSEYATIPELIELNFIDAYKRNGGRLYRDVTWDHTTFTRIHGTIYGASSTNITALTVTPETNVDGLTINENNIYFVELARVFEDVFDVGMSDDNYYMVGVSSVRTTNSSGTTTTVGPCIAKYDGEKTIIYSYKGTTGAITGYYASVVIDYEKI